jgi:hypothetical protein
MSTTPTRALRPAQRLQGVGWDQVRPAAAWAEERIMNKMCHTVTKPVKKKVTVGH